MGFPWFVLRFHAELVPNFSLIINAPNAIRNDLAGAPIDWVKFWAYSDSNSDHGISWAIITQRLSEANFPPWGNSKLSGAVPSGSTFRYTTVNGSAKVWCYFSPRRCTSGSISSSSKACCVTLGLIIQQALIRQGNTRESRSNLTCFSECIKDSKVVITKNWDGVRYFCLGVW